jgi:DNA-binding transcriptional LysR family regulator
MTLNQLYYFQKIAQLQHYRLAAQELNISQPSLSRSMTTLEEELGLILFQHVGRNIELTDYGKVFLQHVDKILDEIESTQIKMQQLASYMDRATFLMYIHAKNSFLIWSQVSVQTRST